MNTRKFERRGLIITETLMVLLAVLWAVPIYYLIVTTLKSPAEATASPLALPSTINLQNYIDAWQKMEFPRAFANTLFITAMSVFLIVLFGSMAGYALARTSSKLGGRLFLFFLAGLVVPFQMNIVSLYKIVKALHLMNSPFAVILVDVAVNMPQAVFLFREFVHSTVPVELEEAAEIDGCGTDAKVLHHRISAAQAGNGYRYHHRYAECLERVYDPAALPAEPCQRCHPAEVSRNIGSVLH